MKKTGVGLGNALSKYADSKKFVLVGFFEEAKYPDGTSVAQVAYWNEYGTIHSPTRPFFRKTIRDNQSSWQDKLKQLVELYKGDTEKVLLLLGEIIKGDLYTTITTWTEPPNAPSTIRKKGFNAPLRDTMQKARSIGVEVTDDES